jgi:hypothetical protein
MHRERPLWRRGRNRRRGQSLVEFALVLPVMLLLVLFGIDFGRIFLGWVQLNNVVREAADFAAENPTAWSTVNPSAVIQLQYHDLIVNEATPINCALPASVPAPQFASGFDGPNAIGSPVTVQISCSFAFITPIIGNMFGGSLPVTASASYPTRSGMIPNIPMASVTPVPSPTPTLEPGATPAPEPTPSPTPSPTPAMCQVPNLLADHAKNAQHDWSQVGGFTSQVVFSPLAPAKWPAGGGTVTAQSITPGLWRSCTSTAITVAWSQ